VRRALGRAGDAALTLLAVAGLLGLAMFVLVHVGLVQPLVVVSGSMQPRFHVGDLVVSRTVAADTLQPGQIASLVSPDGVLVTHRVVSVTPDGDDRVSVVMKGDANPGPDAEPYTATRALVPVVSVPRVGPVVRVLQRPAVAIPGAVALVAVVLIVMLGPSGREPDGAEGTGGAEGAGGTEGAAGSAEPPLVDAGAAAPRHART
jgi:signal peptidase